MKINLKGTNLNITSDISNYLDKRLLGIEKFLPGSDGSFLINVELGKITQHHQTGNIFRAEINVITDGKTLRAVSVKPDLYSAIDEMKDTISRELSSAKEKKISLLRRGGQRIKKLIRGLYKR